MIKINLLPEVKRKVVKKRQKVSREIPFTWIIAGIVAILVTTALLAWNYWTLVEARGVLQDEIVKIEAEIKKLKVQQDLVEKARVQRNALAQKLEIIATLKKRKTGPVQLLDQLAAAIPGRVWLSEMSESGNAMTLTGFSLDHTQIAQFMENLQESPYFNNVELITANSSLEGRQRQSQVGPVPTKQFELTCRVSYPAN